MDLSKQAEIPTVRKDGMLDELGFSGPPRSTRTGMQIRSTGMLKQDKEDALMDLNYYINYLFNHNPLLPPETPPFVESKHPPPPVMGVVDPLPSLAKPCKVFDRLLDKPMARAGRQLTDDYFLDLMTEEAPSEEAATVFDKLIVVTVQEAEFLSELGFPVQGQHVYCRVGYGYVEEKTSAVRPDSAKWGQTFSFVYLPNQEVKVCVLCADARRQGSDGMLLGSVTWRPDLLLTKSVASNNSDGTLFFGWLPIVCANGKKWQHMPGRPLNEASGKMFGPRLKLRVQFPTNWQPDRTHIAYTHTQIAAADRSKIDRKRQQAGDATVTANRNCPGEVQLWLGLQSSPRPSPGENLSGDVWKTSKAYQSPIPGERFDYERITGEVEKSEAIDDLTTKPYCVSKVAPKKSQRSAAPPSQARWSQVQSSAPPPPQPQSQELGSYSTPIPLAANAGLSSPPPPARSHVPPTPPPKSSFMPKSPPRSPSHLSQHSPPLPHLDPTPVVERDQKEIQNPLGEILLLTEDVPTKEEIIEMMSAEQRQKYGAMPPETQNKCYEMLAQEYLRKKIENKGERAAQRRADFLLINKQRMAAQRWDESACRPLQEQISTSNQGERSLSPNKRATSQPPPPQETPAQQAVEINMRLNMDFQAVGQQGSTERQNFTKDLTQDLADASGTGASEFNILKLSPGSVIVDMLAPPKAAQEIQRQSLDPKSRLRNGKVTRFTDTIRLPTVTQQSQPLLPAPLYEIGLKFGDFAPHEVMAVNNVRDEKMRQINNLIQKGDILQHINDTPVQGLNIDELERHILGPKDEMVTLSLFRPSTGQQYQVRVNHHIPIQVKHAGTSPFGTQDKGQTRMKGTEVLLQGEQLSPEEKERMLRLDVDAKHPSPVMTRQKNGNVPECSHCHSPTPVTYLKCGGCRVAAYCSEGCLEVSWKGGHMSRCKQVDQLQGAPIATEGVITSTATKTPPSTPSSTACPPPRTLVLKLKTGADLNQISEAHETNLSGQGSAFESCQSNPSAPMPRVLAVRPPHVSPKVLSSTVVSPDLSPLVTNTSSFFDAQTPDTIVSGPRFPADPELEIQRILLETYSSDGESTQKIDGEKRQELFACLKTLLAKSKELSMQGNQTAAEQLVHKVARYGLLLSGQEEKRGGADGGVCSSGGSTRGVRNESEELRGSPGVSTGKTANPKILTLNTCSLAPAPAPASPSPRKIEFSTLQPQLSPHAQAARSKISPHAQAARVFSPSSPAQLSGRTVSSLSPLLSPHEPAARALSPVPVQMQRVQIVGQFRDPP